MEAHDVIEPAFYFTRGRCVTRIRVADWGRGDHQWLVERFATVHRAWVLDAGVFARTVAIEMALRQHAGVSMWFGRVPRLYLLHRYAAEGWIQDLMLRGLLFANPLSADHDVAFRHPLTGAAVVTPEECAAIGLGVAEVAKRYGDQLRVSAMPDVSMEGLGLALTGRPTVQLTLQQYGCVAARGLYEQARALRMRDGQGGGDMTAVQAALAQAMDVVRRVEGGTAVEQIVELARCRWAYAREVRAKHAPALTAMPARGMLAVDGGHAWGATA